VSFNPTDLVCCRTLQGHGGKVGAHELTFPFSLLQFLWWREVFRCCLCSEMLGTETWSTSVTNSTCKVAYSSSRVKLSTWVGFKRLPGIGLMKNS
jgi:hypothetical protein